MKFMDNLCGLIGDKGMNLINQAEKHSPEIYIGLGIIGMGLTIVSAVKNAKKLDAITDKMHERCATINMIDNYIAEYGREDTAEAFAESNEISSEYVEHFDKDREMLNVAVTTGLSVARTFASTAALFAISTASVLRGYKVLNGRYLGAVAAFNGLSEAFMRYRDRVKKDRGDNWDNYYMTGVNKPKIPKVNFEDTETDMGDFYEEKDTDFVEGRDDLDAEDIVRDPRLPSPYAKFFGPNSSCWTGNYAVDMLFLRGRQSMMTDRLVTKGKLILNEVNDALGYDIDSQGAICGWVKGNGDNKVSFGLEEIEKDESRTIVMKDGRVIFVLDFNVDGIVWDKL